ncbi:unnamed protein product [Tuber melanosporum]|uniref:DNA polymerase delta subunit 3 n=1 Tax=Tuber melanosporum (strain Mel28) TaxID=656061 RepID=D5GJX0_TUBMM|nr:uncharacterized protein GSTUM_00009250001 [Tuber melanosporum]CAZ84813.1 unnamed protein product [Tuber melanosporum]
MGNSKKYPESSIIDECEVVTYRMLACRLEVHANVAKQMLYEFHKCHKKKDESIHATYIITCERKVIEEAEDGDDDEDEDEDMNLSPFEVTPREKKEGFKYQKVVKLIGEERLEEVKAEIENIKTVHVHSLRPSRIKDLTVSSACSERIVNRAAIKAPRPNRPPAIPHAVATAAVSKASEKAETKERVEAKSKRIQRLRRNVNLRPSCTDETGIFYLFTSWGNAAIKKAESNLSSTAHSPKTEEVPVKMELGSEEEEDFEPTLLRDTAEDVKKRRERDDELTKMIEMNIKAKPKRRVREYVSNEEEEELEKQVPEVQKPPEDEPVELPTGSVVSAVTKGGRRRGRRKVNKKVQVKDEDGHKA